MKKYRLLLAVGLTAAFIGCQSGKQVNLPDMEVVEQKDTVYYRNDTLRDRAEFIVDVPVKGPRPLMDSVMVFYNKQLYDACEGCVHIDERFKSYKEEEIFTDDAENVLRHYMNKYRTLITDSIWKIYGYELKMEVQTKKFVTFGVEHFHCGGSCGSEKYYYTFDKSDGHQVMNIISRDNLDRFFKDHPEYTSIDDDPWSGRTGWQYYPEHGFQDYDYGLFDDHFSLAIQGCGNHYILLSLPYDKIFSYLSPETQSLVE